MNDSIGPNPTKNTQYQIVVGLWEFLQGLRLALKFTAKLASRYVFDCVEVKAGENVDCLISSCCGSVFVSSKVTRRVASIGSPMYVLLQSEEVSKVVNVVQLWSDITNKLGLSVVQGNLVISDLSGRKGTSGMRLEVKSYKGDKPFVDIRSVEDRVLRRSGRVVVTIKEYLSQVQDVSGKLFSPVNRGSLTNFLSSISSNIKTLRFVVSKGCLFLKGNRFSLCLGSVVPNQSSEIKVSDTSRSLLEVDVQLHELVIVDPRLLYEVVEELVGDVIVDVGGQDDPLCFTDTGGHTVYMMGREESR